MKINENHNDDVLSRRQQIEKMKNLLYININIYIQSSQPQSYYNWDSDLCSSDVLLDIEVDKIVSFEPMKHKKKNEKNEKNEFPFEWRPKTSYHVLW